MPIRELRVRAGEPQQPAALVDRQGKALEEPHADPEVLPGLHPRIPPGLSGDDDRAVQNAEPGTGGAAERKPIRAPILGLKWKTAPSPFRHGQPSVVTGIQEGPLAFSRDLDADVDETSPGHLNGSR